MKLKRFNNIVEGPMGFKMPEATARRIEKLAKEIPSDFHYTRLGKIPVEFKTGELPDGSKTDTSMVSTDDVDRDNEVILPAGMDLTQYRMNPVVCWAHDYSQLPLGKAMWIAQKDNGIAAMTKYAQRPAGWGAAWLPDAVHSMMQEGMCVGKSVGFMPLSMRAPTSEEIRRRPDWKGVERIIDKALLLEYSVVPVPANGSALTTAVSKAIHSGAMDEAMAEFIRKSADVSSKTFVILNAAPPQSNMEQDASSASSACAASATETDHRPPAGERKTFATLAEARAFLAEKHNGHGRVETPDGQVLHQCRCGGGETVIVVEAADTKANSESNNAGGGILVPPNGAVPSDQEADHDHDADDMPACPKCMTNEKVTKDDAGGMYTCGMCGEKFKDEEDGDGGDMMSNSQKPADAKGAEADAAATPAAEPVAEAAPDPATATADAVVVETEKKTAPAPAPVKPFVRPETVAKAIERKRAAQRVAAVAVAATMASEALDRHCGRI